MRAPLNLRARRKNTAAIGGILAAEKYSLQILEQDIQDNAANATRFLVLGRTCSPPTGDDRTSLMLSVADKSGALHEAHRRVPKIQDQHDENRIASEQAQGVGIFFLH